VCVLTTCDFEVSVASLAINSGIKQAFALDAWMKKLNSLCKLILKVWLQ
jgi:hypothetical protein